MSNNKKIFPNIHIIIKAADQSNGYSFRQYVKYVISNLNKDDPATVHRIAITLPYASLFNAYFIIFQSVTQKKMFYIDGQKAGESILLPI